MSLSVLFESAADRRRDAMTGGAGYVTIRIPASARPTVATAINMVGYLRGGTAHLQPVE